MDANLQFWPEIGDRVEILFGNPNETGRVLDKFRPHPTDVLQYKVQNLTTGKIVNKFRYQLSRASPVTVTNGFSDFSVMDTFASRDSDNIDLLDDSFEHFLSTIDLDQLHPDDQKTTAIDTQNQLENKPPHADKAGRFLKLSSDDIDMIAQSRTEKTTDRSTKWALSTFKG